MKNVLCLKRMYALQLPSQFFYTYILGYFFFFSKISVSLFEETLSDPQFFIRL